MALKPLFTSILTSFCIASAVGAISWLIRNYEIKLSMTRKLAPSYRPLVFSETFHADPDQKRVIRFNEKGLQRTILKLINRDTVNSTAFNAGKLIRKPLFFLVYTSFLPEAAPTKKLFLNILILFWSPLAFYFRFRKDRPKLSSPLSFAPPQSWTPLHLQR